MTHSEVLNITEEMISDLIIKVEESIFVLAKDQESKIPELKEAESIYLPLKQEYDRLSEKIEKEKQMLDALIGFRENKNERKQIRVYKSISNGEKPRKRRKQYPFMKEALVILEQEQKFLRPETLVQKIFDRNPSWKVLFQNGMEKSVKSKAAANLKYQAEGKLGTKTLKISWYNERIGLAEWMKNGSPKPNFLRSVMA